jgi:PilZ domain-containing protein
LEVVVVDLPRIGTPMYVVHSDGVNYRSRLEAIEGDRWSLAAPLETQAEDVPAAGHLVEIFWALPRARMIVPCRMVGMTEEAPFRWVLEPVGSPRTSNRREFVRGGGGGPVRLAAEAEETVVVGRLLDISEGGLRCWVEQLPEVGRGEGLILSVPLGRNELELSGAVHTVRDAYDEPGQHVILTFRTGEREARLIRQHVFAWEIEERRRFDQA